MSSVPRQSFQQWFFITHTEIVNYMRLSNGSQYVITTSGIAWIKALLDFSTCPDICLLIGFKLYRRSFVMNYLVYPLLPRAVVFLQFPEGPFAKRKKNSLNLFHYERWEYENISICQVKQFMNTGVCLIKLFQVLNMCCGCPTFSSIYVII